ncbi:nitric oxide-sensing protein NosP [Vibrio japonicus]|uniref:FIST C-terminal domain-containing protein n=1 Tax=Vibrio japonicus TaxID=1824638 RepID=A0ABY5LF31_9VIBR|nr:nitric oxide-sensing protein NosP [Vibrio japonicus]UUM29556.1 FIST C-terminal domain-containing protein [Vibrio japonicus]
MTNIITKHAISKSPEPIQASKDIYQQLGKPQNGFVLFYCSAVYPLNELAAALSEQFTDIELAGCTTAGEVTNQGYDQHSIIAIWFSPEYFSINAAVIDQFDSFDLITAQSKINQLSEACNLGIGEGNQYRSFLLTLIDGLSAKEEQLLSVLNMAASGLPHFGGSAGDDINLANTHVYHQGAFIQNAAVVIMVHSRCRFEVFSSNHIESSKEKLVVTCADSQTRTVLELNSEPAAQEYARILGLEVSQLNPEVFSLYPLAVKVGGKYYARSIQKVNHDDLSLTFYCAVDTGIVLSAVEMGSITGTLADKLSTIEQTLNQAECVLACDCFLRRLEIEQRQQLEPMRQLQSQYNIFGFNTYGEHINGTHLNQTFTGVYLSGEVYE